MSLKTVTGSSSCDLYSHRNPDKLLRDHLSAVAQFCETEFLETKPDFKSIGISKEVMEIFCRLIGLCHDFGKATPFFQDYLFTDDEKSRLTMKTDKRTQHGLISAIFAYQCIKEAMKEIQNAQCDLLPYIGYIIIRRHHGNLNNFSDEVIDIRNPDRIDYLKIQYKEISRQAINTVYDGFLPQSYIDAFFENFDAIIKSIVSDGKIFRLRPFLEKISEFSVMEVFVLYCYSLLLAGDKGDAASLTISRNLQGLPPDIIDSYRNSAGFIIPKSPIDKIRNDIYTDVISKIGTLDLNKRIYSLNVPTGTGKTLTSVSFALKLRGRIIKEQGIVPRIIYCLPFMSIIDQNYDVIATVLSSQSNTPLTSDILLKHHHLTDISYSKNDDEYDEDAAQLMIEGWQSEFIITTFVQFFHSILSNRNRAIRKYHTLANAIIILDEVQSIPHEYWLLFREIIKTIAQHLHATVIFVTATQPLIFNEESGDLIELVSDKKRYFSKLDRVKLHIATEPESVDEFIEKVRLHIQREPEKDFLFVLNTINTAKRVFTSLSNGNDKNTEYVYLSTHVIPKERLKRIGQIKDKDSKKRKIIVSTQLIEAGVDIDVDIVYRDMAPLDSINQVAGRCNRNGRSEEPGEVNIVNLQDDHRQLWGYIYSQHLISQTKILFENTRVIAEHQILELNNRYFHLVEQTQSDDKAKKCLSLVRCLKFSDLQKEFHLIQGEYPKIDVFVECDEAAHDIWRSFVEIKSKPSLERRSEFLKIKKQFFDYVISVPENKFLIPIDNENGIGRITHAELNQYYDKEIGFTPKDGGTLII